MVNRKKAVDDKNLKGRSKYVLYSYILLIYKHFNLKNIFYYVQSRKK